MDQADTLRQLMQLRKGLSSGARRAGGSCGPRVVTFASGGKGDGKSSVSSHLAALLARSGKSVLVANSDWMRPLHPMDAYAPEAGQPREGYVACVEPRLHFGYFSEAFYSACNSTGLLEHGFAHVLGLFGLKVDVVFVEAGLMLAGADSGYAQKADLTNVIVVTPDERALSRTRELLANLRRQAGVSRVGVIVNKVRNVAEGRKVFKGLAESAVRFVDTQLEYLGCVPREEKIARALVSRKILVDLSRGDSSSACLRLVSKRLESWGLTEDISDSTTQDSTTRSVYGRTGV